MLYINYYLTKPKNSCIINLINFYLFYMSIYQYELTNQQGQNQKKILFLNPDQVESKLANGWQIKKIWQHKTAGNFDFLDASILSVNYSRDFMGRPVLLLEQWQRLASKIKESTRFYFDNQKALDTYKALILKNRIYLEYDGALIDATTKDLILSRLVYIDFSQKNFIKCKD